MTLTCRVPCARCKGLGFCTELCQRCRPIIILPRSARPSPRHRQAILFPSRKAVPEYIWIRFGEAAGGEHGQEGPQDVHKYMGTESNLDKTSFPHAKACGCVINFLTIYSRSAYFEKSLPPNGSIRAATQGPVPYYWPGPVVVIRENGRRSPEAGSFEDMGTDDYHHVVEYFKSDYAQLHSDGDVSSGFRRQTSRVKPQ